MIKKKYIYRFLAFGLSFNNLLIFSNAHNMEVPDRYQTLEGEYITIEDSIEDKLYEIEIFGNTVQDENNLEDIQSVGALYINEDGNPILDSQGREQYKIDIISSNNFINSEDIIDNNDSANSHKTTLLLPTQLHKVGDVADRLYWDDEKGKYIIEKNIDVQTPPITSYTTILGQIFNNNEIFTFKIPSEIKYSKAYTSDNEKGLIVSSLKVCDSSKYNDIGYDSYIYKASNEFSIIFSRGTFLDEPRFVEWLAESNLTFYYSEGFTPQLIETNITSKIKIPTYEGRTYIYTETENEVGPTLKVTVDRLTQVAKKAVENAQLNPTVENISIARMYINMLSESINKDQLHDELNYIFNTDIKLDKKTISSSVDIYIKFDNSISMALSTNSITFEDLSGVNDVEMQNAVEILVSSSLPYQLNAYLVDEIYNSDKTKKIDIDRLEIKESKANTYKPFVSINNKVVLEDNCESGNNLLHNIDLKLYGSNAYQSDIYKTVIKFEAEQK